MPRAACARREPWLPRWRRAERAMAGANRLHADARAMRYWSCERWAEGDPRHLASCFDITAHGRRVAASRIDAYSCTNHPLPLPRARFTAASATVPAWIAR